MTAKKDFKRRVRERQQKTGESYTAARAQLLAARDEEPAAKPPPISVVEFADATEDAARLGLKCDVLMTTALASKLSAARVLEKLRDALLATEHDPQLDVLRALVFRGVRIAREAPSGRQWWRGVWRFLERAEAGIGGITEAGHMLAICIDGVMVIAHADYVQRALTRPRQRLFLTDVDIDRLHGDMMLLPR
jgi:hypothetical protein